VGQVAQQVRRHGCVTNVPAQGAAGREPTPEKDVRDAQLSAELLKEAMAKNGEAISTPGAGPIGSGERTHEYPARLPDVCIERDRLSLSGQGERGECADR